MGISYRAVCIHAKNRAMKICAALVRSPWIAAAIVERTGEISSAASAVMKDQVSEG